MHVQAGQRELQFTKLQEGAHLVFSRSFLVRSVACWPPFEVLCRACSSCFSLSTSSRCFCLLMRTHLHSVCCVCPVSQMTDAAR